VEVDYNALKESGFTRQKQKDRFSLRIKVVGGDLSAEQLNVVAKVSESFGAGRVHLTSRQGLEIPHVKLENIEAVKLALAKGGVEAGVLGPKVRTVTACQGPAVCRWGCVPTLPLAKEFASRYLGRILPRKFKFGVTGCANNCLKAEENDLGVKGGYLVEYNPAECHLCGLCVKACRDKAISRLKSRISFDKDKCVSCGRCAKSCPTGSFFGEPAYFVFFGGTFGRDILKGRKLTPLARDSGEVLKASDAALDFFEKRGEKGERFRTTIERVGWETLAVFLAERA
jgi:dissimilatory sulfite reductase (desulfoviridin) alpha/beta subunit